MEWVFSFGAIVSCLCVSLNDVHAQLKIIDYSNVDLRSDIPRSNKVALSNKFSWNGYAIEKDELEQKYPPLVDLSYGSPNYMPAETVVNALIEVTSNKSHPGSYEIHQYTRAMGHPLLVRAVAKFYSPLMKRDINPMREVLITAGSLNSLDLAARTFIDPGDEVILFEPFYYNYRNDIKLAGGKIVTVPLRPKSGASAHSSNDLTFDKSELESKITKKTKIIWINNPNNPTGKVYTLEELTCIGNLAKKYDLLVLADEAAQWYIYDEPQHIRIATLPGMFERTITLTSGGKKFSNTGWRVAWVIGPENLIYPLAETLEPGMCSVATAMQLAFAKAIEEEHKLLGTPQSFFTQIQRRASNARDQVVDILRSVGVDVIKPTAGYCIVANFSNIMNQIDISAYPDKRPGFALYKYFLINRRLATYPIALMFDEQNAWKAEYTIRFTFFKTQNVYDGLAQLMPQIFKPIKEIHHKARPIYLKIKH